MLLIAIIILNLNHSAALIPYSPLLHPKLISLTVFGKRWPNYQPNSQKKINLGCSKGEYRISIAE